MTGYPAKPLERVLTLNFIFHFYGFEHIAACIKVSLSTVVSPDLETLIQFVQGQLSNLEGLILGSFKEKISCTYISISG